MSVFPLSDLLEASFAGEWGTENGENRVQVLRTANFNEDGSFDYFNPAWRCISEKKVMSKTMRRGDIVLEKSGGTPKRPVGIMAYYDSDDLALCSNFNHILRLNPAKVSPRYAFHQLRWLKEKGAFEPYTRKTTGLQNLQMKKFAGLKLKVPPDAYQRKVISILDFIVASRIKHHREISNLHTLVKSRFIEMFGDLRANPMDWPVVGFDTFAVIDTKMTKDFERFADYPHIGIDSIESGSGALTGYRTVKEDAVKSGKYPFTPKHIIYSKIRPALNKVALPNFEGVCSADAYPILPDTKICNRVFLAHVMRSPFFLEYVLPLSGRAQMPKVNKDALKGFECPMPPLELQQEFASFVAQAAKLEFVAQRQNADPVQYNTHRSEEER